jgi:alkylation response protein AidB-like acyl-CoA dehydrogenase
MPTSPSAALLLSRRDLSFQLYDWLDAASLTGRPRYAEHSRETFDAVLELAEQLAARYFAPHNRRNDVEEPRFDGTRVHLHPEVKEALDAFARSDLLGATMDAELGGMQLPHLVATACFAWFQAANIATSAYPFLTLGNARLLCAHASPELVRTYVPPMLAGRFHGTMCPSEPQAGSSLADVTTRAEPQPDGTYLLFGAKMWISAGDHELGENIVHLVLARVPGGPPGREGSVPVRRAEGAPRGGRHARRAQRRGAGRAQPQDGLPRHDQHAAQLRRGRAPARLRAGRPGLHGGPELGSSTADPAHMFHMLASPR